jgi:hypothetical protein
MLLAAVLLLAQAPGPGEFDAGLAQVEAAMAERRWDDALHRLDALLEEHRGAVHARAQRAAVEEILRRCLFWRDRRPPDPDALISGRLRSWNARTGRLHVEYGAESLDDFRRGPDGIEFPPRFTGPYRVTLSGGSYPAEGMPCLVVDGGADHEYAAVFGAPGRGAGGLFRATEQGFVPLGEPRPSPLEGGERFLLELRVGRDRITGEAGGTLVVDGPRERGEHGRLRLAGFPAGSFDRLVIQGPVEPSWIEGKIDAEVQEQRAAFDAALDLGPHLPAWMLDDAGLTAPAVAPVAHPAGRPSTAWPRLAKLLGGERAAPLAAFLADPPRELPAPERWWAEARLAELRGRPADAVEPLMRLCRAQPGFRPAQLQLAERMLETGESARAVLEAAPGAAWAAPLRELLAKADRGPAFGRRWSVETRHYEVVSDIDRAVCAAAGKLLEQHHNAYRSRLGTPPPAERRFPVYLFSGFAGYERYVADLGYETAEGTAGLYSPLLKQLLVWNLPDREAMFRTVVHEGFHQYLDAIVPVAPVWLDEGLAEYFEVAGFEQGRWIEGQRRSDHLAVLARLPEERRRASRLLGLTGEGFRADRGTNYALAWAFVHFLRQGGNRERALQDALLGELRGGLAPGEAVDAVFPPESREGLERRFRAHLQALLDAD